MSDAMTKERPAMVLTRNHKRVDVHDVAIELRDRIRANGLATIALFILPDGVVQIMPKHGQRFETWVVMKSRALVGVYDSDAHTHEIIDDINAILAERGRR